MDDTNTDTGDTKMNAKEMARMILRNVLAFTSEVEMTTEPDQIEVEAAIDLVTRYLELSNEDEKEIEARIEEQGDGGLAFDIDEFVSLTLDYLEETEYFAG